MRFRERTTGEILSLDQVRVKFPNTSFPVDWTPETYNFANVDGVVEVEKPQDTALKVFVDDGVKKSDKDWKQTWKEVDRYTPEQMSAMEKDRAQKLWDTFRAERNSRLTEMDNVLTRHKELIELGNEPFSSDSVFSRELYLDILKYKNELRDLPTKITDTENVDWPINPLNNILFYKNKYVPSPQVSVVSN